MINPTPIALDQPRMIDQALQELQTVLTTGLSWLTSAYGRAYKLERNDNGRRVAYPGVPGLGTEFVDVRPDEHLGNYSFFDIPDDQDIEDLRGQQSRLTTEFGLVFFFDLRTVYGSDWETRTNENVKADVLQVLRTASTPTAAFRLTRLTDRAENVYRGYTLEEAKEQFTARPYGIFRISGEIKYYESCS